LPDSTGTIITKNCWKHDTLNLASEQYARIFATSDKSAGTNLGVIFGSDKSRVPTLGLSLVQINQGINLGVIFGSDQVPTLAMVSRSSLSDKSGTNLGDGLKVQPTVKG
jgi:hypothetical protein